MNSTISDEHCTDIMRYDVLGVEIVPFEFSQGINPRILASLTEDDKYLLEDYAPKLFNTILQPKYLKEYMFKLAILLDRYRGAKLAKEKEKEVFGEIKYSKSSQEKRKEHFIDSINEALSIIDSPSPAPMHLEDYHRKINLVKELQHFKDNFERFMPRKNNTGNLFIDGRVTLSKAPIKEYLHGLQLTNKTNEINSFITSIS